MKLRHRPCCWMTPIFVFVIKFRYEQVMQNRSEVMSMKYANFNGHFLSCKPRKLLCALNPKISLLIQVQKFFGRRVFNLDTKPLLFLNFGVSMLMLNYITNRLHMGKKFLSLLLPTKGLSFLPLFAYFPSFYVEPFRCQIYTSMFDEINIKVKEVRTLVRGTVIDACHKMATN